MSISRSVAGALALFALAVCGITATSASAAATFGSPTVVDNYRPGFEPDVAVDTSPHGGGVTYTSTPFGFSTTQSIVYRSDDNRRSFHLVEGNIFGKPTTCVGGGDSELKIDPLNGELYFVDLQGLTNISASTSDDHGATWDTNCTAVNGTGVDRQWLGIDSNGGSSAVGSGPAGGSISTTTTCSRTPAARAAPAATSS